MALAHQCDRCKSFYTDSDSKHEHYICSEAVVGMQFCTYRANVSSKRDLCPRCVAQLYNFMEGKNN